MGYVIALYIYCVIDKKYIHLFNYNTYIGKMSRLNIKAAVSWSEVGSPDIFLLSHVKLFHTPFTIGQEHAQ